MGDLVAEYFLLAELDGFDVQRGLMIVEQEGAEATPAAGLRVPVAGVFDPRQLDRFGGGDLLLCFDQIGVAFVAQVLFIDGVEKDVGGEL